METALLNYLLRCHLFYYESKRSFAEFVGAVVRVTIRSSPHERNRAIRIGVLKSTLHLCYRQR